MLSTYLGKIARQISIDVFRKKHAAKRFASEYAISLDELGDSFSDGITQDQTLNVKLLDSAINHFVRTLPDEVQRAFVGRYAPSDFIGFTFTLTTTAIITATGRTLTLFATTDV